MLDLHNNFTVNVTGHNHPHVEEALIDAVRQGYSFANPVRREHELAKMLCDRIDAVERIVFSCSASESCMTAIRIARANTGRPKIAKLEGGYHGFADEFMISVHPSAAQFPGTAADPLPDPNTKGMYPQVRDNVLVLPQNDLESCTRILSAQAGDVACVILELMTGAGGPMVLEADFVRGLRQVTRELGILMIIDETVTVRSSIGGMQAEYAADPDLTVLGKAIGGGLPLGAVGGKEELFRCLENGQVHHSGTHHGHPLATAAGIANLEVMDESVCERLNRQGEFVISTLNQWAGEQEHLFDVYGTGSLIAYVFPNQPGREFRSCRDLAAYTHEERMDTFAFEMATRDIYVLERGTMSLSEPMTDANIDTIIDNTRDVVRQILA